MWLEYIKVVHVSCAVFTGFSFFLRGILLLRESPWLRHPVIRTVPHIIDTILLASALVLVFSYSWNPLQMPWLLGKIVALLVYIVLGLLAFRFADNRGERLFYWMTALVVLGHIYFFAWSRSVGWIFGVF